MVGYYTMRLPNADSVYRLIRKLDKQNDISLKEADWIYSLLSPSMLRTKLNPRSVRANCELMNALVDWFNIVAQKIEQGHRGNFIFTITFNRQRYIDELTLPARKAIKKYGVSEDLYDVIVIDEKLYSVLPYKHVFREIKYRENLKSIYKIETTRAGLYRYPIKVGHLTYTIGELINDQLAPVVTIPLTNSPDGALYREVFKVATGARDITQDPYFGKKEIELFTLAAFIKNKGISCVATINAENHFVVFVEKGQIHIAKEAMNIPFDKIVENATRENVIDKNMAKTLLNSEYIAGFPMIDFINTSVKYIDSVVQTKLEWQSTRKMVEDEPGWVEETR